MRQETLDTHVTRRQGPTRLAAACEVILCSGFPTQLGLALIFGAIGYRAGDVSLTLSYVVALSLADTAVLIALIFVFLRASGEEPRGVFLGTRSPGEEARAGLPLVLVAFGIALATLAVIQAFAPWLHTVERNPLQQLVTTPGQASLFAVVVVVAGGVREELQRAFLLRRFEAHLGGATVGVVTASIAFGAAHLLQGADAAIATGLLGAFWGVIYLRRRSVVAPVVSHAGFNLLQLAQFLMLGR
jgi:membrane protease YdiL (CAAX protease family)